MGHLVGGVVGAGSSLPLPHGGVAATLDADVAAWGATGLNRGFQEALSALQAAPGGQLVAAQEEGGAAWVDAVTTQLCERVMKDSQAMG